MNTAEPIQAKKTNQNRIGMVLPIDCWGLISGWASFAKLATYQDPVSFIAPAVQSPSRLHAGELLQYIVERFVACFPLYATTFKVNQSTTSHSPPPLVSISDPIRF